MVLLILGIICLFVTGYFHSKIKQSGEKTSCYTLLNNEICSKCTNNDCLKIRRYEKTKNIFAYAVIALLYAKAMAEILLIVADHFARHEIGWGIMTLCAAVFIITYNTYQFVCTTFEERLFEAWTDKTTISTIVYLVATIIHMNLPMFRL